MLPSPFAAESVASELAIDCALLKLTMAECVPSVNVALVISSGSVSCAPMSTSNAVFLRPAVAWYSSAALSAAEVKWKAPSCAS